MFKATLTDTCPIPAVTFTILPESYSFAEMTLILTRITEMIYSFFNFITFALVYQKTPRESLPTGFRALNIFHNFNI